MTFIIKAMQKSRVLRSTTTQNSQLFTLERSGNAENPARRAGYVNDRTFPRVAGDG